jgi:hypothetical protein
MGGSTIALVARLCALAEAAELADEQRQLVVGLLRIA